MTTDIKNTVINLKLQYSSVSPNPLLTLKEGTFYAKTSAFRHDMTTASSYV